MTTIQKDTRCKPKINVILNYERKNKRSRADSYKTFKFEQFNLKKNSYPTLAHVVDKFYPHKATEFKELGYKRMENVIASQ